MVEKKGFRFENVPADFADAEDAILTAEKWMKKRLDLMILDEINTTVKTGLLKVEKIVNLLGQKPAHLELILTGRYAPDEVLKFGDLITEMTMVKHYMSEGIPARKGIEF
jgi:cob(I)alamin adenosyltransferase